MIELIIYFTLFWVSVLIFAIILADWLTHIEMVKDNVSTYTKGTYNDFIYQMSIHKWERKSTQPKSFFGVGKEYYKNKVHASIIMFDGVGMIFNIYDWLLVKKYLHTHGSKEVKKHW